MQKKDAGIHYQARPLLRRFDRLVAEIAGQIEMQYGKRLAELLLAEFHLEYAAIIPQIPYIGRGNPQLSFLIPTTQYLAVYRVMKNHGLPLSDIGKLVYRMAEEQMQLIPSMVRKIIHYLWFSPWFIKRAKKRAKESLRREHPGNFVMHFIEGDGINFDFGIDYIECANCKFLLEHDAWELAPFSCATDKVASEYLGWGLTRTSTLAEKAEKCDFRFKKDRETNVAMNIP